MGHVDLRDRPDLKRRLSVECNITEETAVPPTLILHGTKDRMAEGGVSRMKVETSGQMAEGEMKKAYHHGRCDVGSPFATGKLFDLEEPGCGG